MKSVHLFLFIFIRIFPVTLFGQRYISGQITEAENNEPMDMTVLDMININDIAQIDLLKGGNTVLLGARGFNGVIAIYTKTGKTGQSSQIASQTFHTKTILPLGFQQPVEFYAPKYDTQEKRNATVPDLRTTIHWQPVVQTENDGVASFEFYTADEACSYTVVIEGLTNDGKIIRQEGKIKVE